MGVEGKFGAEEFREVLDRVLADLDADERRGTMLRAAGLSVKLELTDLGVAVSISASDEPGHHLHWSFDGDATQPRLSLSMDGETANAYLQGRESLAVAVARGRVTVTGDSRSAIVFLPAMRLMAEPYRRWVERLHPQLALA